MMMKSSSSFFLNPLKNKNYWIYRHSLTIKIILSVRGNTLQKDNEKENNNQINSGSTKEFVVSLSPRMLFDRTVKYFLVAQLVVLIMDAVATNKPIVYLELISDTM